MMMATSNDARHEHAISPITPEHDDDDSDSSLSSAPAPNGTHPVHSQSPANSTARSTNALVQRLDNWRRDFVRRTAQTCRHNELVSAAKRLATPTKPEEVAFSTAVADEQHITRILAREFQSFVLIMSKACRVLYADDNMVQELLGNVGDDNCTSSQHVLPVTTLVGENLLHYVHAEDQAKSRIQLRQTLDETIQNGSGYTPGDPSGGKASATGVMPNNQPFKLPSAIEPLCAFAVRLRSGVGSTTSASLSPTKPGFTGGVDGKIKTEPQKFSSSSPSLSYTSPTVWMQYHLCLLKGSWIKTNASILTGDATSVGDTSPPSSQDSKAMAASTWSNRLLHFLSTSNTSYKELDYIWFGIVKVVKPNAIIMSPNCFTMTLGLMALPPGGDPCGSGKSPMPIDNGENGNGSNASTPGSNNGNSSNNNGISKKENKKRLRSGSEATKQSKRNFSGENEFFGKLSILDVDQRCTCLTGFFASEMCDTQFFYYINPYYIPLVVNNLTKMILRESDICTCTVKMRNAYETNFCVDLLLTVTAQPNFSNRSGGFSGGLGTSPPVLFLNCVVSPSLYDLNVKTPSAANSYQFHLDEINKTCDSALFHAAEETFKCWTYPGKLKTETKLAVLSGCLYKLYESVLAEDNNGISTDDGEPDSKRPRISGGAISSSSRFYCTSDEHAFVPMPLNSTRNDLSSPIGKNFPSGPVETGGKPNERRASLVAAGQASRTASLTAFDTSAAAESNTEPNHILVQQLVNGSGVFDDAVTRARMLEAANNVSGQYQKNFVAGAMMLNSNMPQNVPVSATPPSAGRKFSNIAPTALPMMLQQPPEMKDRQLKELLSQPIDSEKRFRCINLGPTVTGSAPPTSTPTSSSTSTTFTTNNKKLLNGGAVTVPSPQNNNAGGNAMMWGGNASTVASGGMQQQVIMQPQHQVMYGGPGGGPTVVMSTADGNLYSTAAPLRGGGGQMVMMGPVVSGGPNQHQMPPQYGGGAGGMYMASGPTQQQHHMMNMSAGGGGGQISPNFSPSPVASGGLRGVRIMSPNGQQQHVLVRGGPMSNNMRPLNGGGIGTPVSMVVSGTQQQQQGMMDADMRGQPPMYFAGPPPTQQQQQQTAAGMPMRFQPSYAASGPMSPNSSGKQQQLQQQLQQQNAPIRQLQQQLREKHSNIEQNLKMQDEDLARMKQDVIGSSNMPFANAQMAPGVGLNISAATVGGPPPSSGAGDFPSATITPVSAARGAGGGGRNASPQQQQVVEKISRLQQRSSMQKHELGELNVKLATASVGTNVGVGNAPPPPIMSSPPTSMPTVGSNPAVISNNNNSIPTKLQSRNASVNISPSGVGPSFSPHNDQQQQQASMMMMHGRGPQQQQQQQTVPYNSMSIQQQQRFTGPPPSGMQQQQQVDISAHQQGLARRPPMRQQQQQQPMVNFPAALDGQQQHAGVGGMPNSGSYVGGGPSSHANLYYSTQPPNNSGGDRASAGLDPSHDALLDDLISTLGADMSAGGDGGGQQSMGRQQDFMNNFLE